VLDPGTGAAAAAASEAAGLVHPRHDDTVITVAALDEPVSVTSLARTLIEHMLADAASRGARTATLQSTRTGQRLYESLGFAAVGRYEEWIPQ
jgi:ribosomal protein S18 acetylase RimI-like enzyme